MNLPRTLRWSLPAALLLSGCALFRSAPETKAPAPPPQAESKKSDRPGLTVEVDKVIAPVNRNVLSGYNFGNWMPLVDYIEDFQAVRVAELRFPGGNVGDENDLTDPALANFQSNLKMLADPVTVIHTRVFQGGISKDPPKNRPEDAAENVRMAKKRGIKVRYWEIGNEPDLFAVTRGDKSWTPEKYCEVFRAQAAAIKAVDPTAKVAGPAASGARGGRETFIAGFVKGCGDVVDILTWHIYPTDGTASDEFAFGSVGEADETVKGFTALWKDKASNPKGHTRPIEFGITEYGLSWFTSRMNHLTDMPAAMWATEMAFRFNELGVASAHYFALHATGGHGLIDQGGMRRPTYFAFRILGGLAGDLVPARTGDADVWSHAARSGTRLDVVLSNTAKAAKTLPVELPGYTLREATYFDAKIVDDEAPLGTLAPAPALTLPARSMAHLVYERSAQ